MNGDLAAAYDQGAKLQDNHQQGPTMKDVARSAAAAAAESRFERWRHDGARLLADLQRRLSEAQATYTTGKAVILAEAERKRDELQVVYTDRLRAFDREHSTVIKQLQAEVSELLDYREIGNWT